MAELPLELTPSILAKAFGLLVGELNLKGRVQKKEELDLLNAPPDKKLLEQKQKEKEQKEKE